MAEIVVKEEAQAILKKLKHKPENTVRQMAYPSKTIT